MIVIVHTDDTTCSTVLSAVLQKNFLHKQVLLEAGNLSSSKIYFKKIYVYLFICNSFSLLFTYFVHMVFSLRRTFRCPVHYRYIQFTTPSVIVNFVPLCMYGKNQNVSLLQTTQAEQYMCKDLFHVAIPEFYVNNSMKTVGLHI